jgi:hypothetical protein
MVLKEGRESDDQEKKLGLLVVMCETNLIAQSCLGLPTWPENDVNPMIFKHGLGSVVQDMFGTDS